MKIIKHLDKLSITLFVSGVLLMGYGELSRTFKIYFFWESQPIGGLLFISSLISMLWDYLIYKFNKHKYGFLIIKYITVPGILLMAMHSMYANKHSEPYQTAELYIYNSIELKNELGKFEIGVIPYLTELRIHQINSKISGEAKFGLILKGENKYSDYEISLLKNFEDDKWRIKK